MQTMIYAINKYLTFTSVSDHLIIIIIIEVFSDILVYTKSTETNLLFAYC